MSIHLTSSQSTGSTKWANGGSGERATPDLDSNGSESDSKPFETGSKSERGSKPFGRKMNQPETYLKHSEPHSRYPETQVKHQDPNQSLNHSPNQSLNQGLNQSLDPESDKSGLNIKDSFFSLLLGKLRKRFVVECNPADFASVMGTGISANILYNFPFPRPWLQTISYVVGVLSACIFTFLLVTHILGVLHNRALLVRMHRDPAYAPFIGCFVMGYTSLVMYLNAILDGRHIIAVWVLFWVVAAGSVYTALITLFLSSIAKSRKSPNYLESSKITMAFLLPVVTLTVAASCGQLVAPKLPHVYMQVTTMMVSVVMWSVAMCLAFIIVTINFWRLFVYKTPHSGQVLMMFLPIGYAGQGAFGILLFGRNCVSLIMENAASLASSPYTSGLRTSMADGGTAYTPAVLSTSIFVVSSIFAVMSMSFGYFLTFLAFLSVLSKISPFCKKPNGQFVYSTSSESWWKRLFVGFLRFHRGFWSMTFPLGTMSLANSELYRTFNGLKTFRYIGAIYAGCLFFIVLGCLFGIVYRFVSMVYASARPPRPKEGEC